MNQTATAHSFFDRLQWLTDRMVTSDLTFRLQHARDDKTWEGGEDCFVFYKTKSLVDQYQRFFSFRPEFKAKNLFELGMWDGGSVAFWFEFLKPSKHVGIDYTVRENSRYFERYLESRKLRSNISTHWGVDQRDAARLLEIYKREFTGPLDLVFDDASHIYGPTKTSFETLFPLLRTGGLYIIEDWAWGHWPALNGPSGPFGTSIPPTRLIHELTSAIGTSTKYIANLTIFEGFVVVERGPGAHEGAFVLDANIVKERVEPTFAERAARSVKRRVSNLIGRS
jgi:hypothetical protein